MDQEHQEHLKTVLMLRIRNISGFESPTSVSHSSHGIRAGEEEEQK